MLSQPSRRTAAVDLEIEVRPGNARRTVCRSRCQPEHSMRTQDVRPGARMQEPAHPFVEIITPELHRAVRYDAHAIRAVPRHHPLEPLLAPDLRQRLRDAHLIFAASARLDLQQDLEALEGRHDGARDGTRHAAGDERRDDGLRNP
nr:hypothetical protein CFP56_01332 [Quercus suber]